MVDPITIGGIAGAALGGGVAISKLLDVAKSGIGAVARPWMTKRDARAKAEADKILEAGRLEIEEMKRKALPPAPDLQAPRSAEMARAVDEAVEIDVEFEDVPPLAQRTEERLTYQEEKRQLNVESVIREAAEELKDVREVSKEAVNDDWSARFFTDVQDVSDEQMRKLWARILAGEVKKPGSFSLRTLTELKNIDPKDAARFQTIAALATRSGAIYMTEYATSLLPIDVEMNLAEAGLLTHGPGLGLSNKFDRQPDGATFSTVFRDVVVIAKNATRPPELSFSARALTRVGRELSEVLVRETDRRQIKAIVELAKQRGFQAAAHLLLARAGDTVSFANPPIELPD